MSTNMISTVVLYLSITFLTAVMIHASFRERRLTVSYLMPNRRVTHSYSVLLLITIIVLTVFATIRPVGEGYGGTDAAGYIWLFDTMDSSKVTRALDIHSFNDILNRQELLYVLFTRLIKVVSGDFRVYFLCIYLFIAYSMTRFVDDFFDKHSSIIPLLYIVPTFIYTFNIIRGGIAVSWCMLAFCSVKNKRYVKSFLMILCGFLFHYIAIMFCLVPIACIIADKVKIYTRHLVYVVILGNVSVIILLERIFAYMKHTRYEAYTSFDQNKSWLGHIPTFFICGVAVFMYKRMKDDRISKICILSLTLNLALQSFAIFLNGWRMGDFFVLIEMCFMERLIRFFKGSKYKQKIIYIYLTIGFACLRVLQSFISLYKTAGVFPYFG